MRPLWKWIPPALVGFVLLGLMVADVARVLVRPEARQVAIIGAGQYEFTAAEPVLDLRESARHQGEGPFAPWTGFSFAGGWTRLTQAGVWAVGDRSAISVSLADTRPRTLFLECRAFPGLAAGVTQRLEAVINGASCGAVDLAVENRRYELPIPAGTLVVGENQIELRHAAQRSPREAWGRNDSRPLAAHYRRIGLLRAGTPPARAGSAGAVAADEASGVVTISAAGRLVLPFTVDEPVAAVRLGYALRGGGAKAARARFRVAHLDAGAFSILDHSVVDAGASPSGQLRLKVGGRRGDLALVCELDGAGTGLSLVVRNPHVVVPPPSRVENDRRRLPRPSPAARPEESPDVVLLILDAARVDRLGRTYGYGRPTTPLIDRVARSSLVFTDVRAQAPYTSCSVPTMISGLGFATHGVVDRVDRLHEDEVTLAELLAAAGYRTMGFSASVNNSRRLGFEQGFDDFVELWREVPAQVAIDPFFMARRVRSALEQGTGDGPLFLMVHLVPPHSPYRPRAEFHRWGDPAYEGDCDGSEEYLQAVIRHEVVPDADDIREMNALYDGNLLMADRALGRILGALVEHRRPDNTLLVITSDHGEAFFEHGEQGHNSTVYEEMVRVPLIIRLPGGARPEGIDLHRQASLEDLVPTILGVVGVDPPERARGLDLLVAEDSERPRNRMVFRTAPNPGVLGIRVGRYKAMVGPELRVREVYDLDDDPGETRNLATAQPLLMSLMEHALARHLASSPRPYEGQGEALVTAADRAALEALGYAR